MRISGAIFLDILRSFSVDLLDVLGRTGRIWGLPRASSPHYQVGISLVYAASMIFSTVSTWMPFLMLSTQASFAGFRRGRREFTWANEVVLLAVAHELASEKSGNICLTS